MRTLIASEALSHMELFAQSQQRLGNSVGLYTTTPRFKLRGFPPGVAHHFVPGPVQLMRGLAMNRLNIPRYLYDWDSSFFDKLCARVIEKTDLVLGAASSSLRTGRAVKKSGGKYVLDRACPDIRVQQAMLIEEARKVGGTFEAAPDWFLQNQVLEYEESDFIVVPSDYSRRSFPQHIKDKTIIARLTGAVAVVPEVQAVPERPFTVGVVGGQPMRKGYLYLLQAWKELGWSDAVLKLRTSATLLNQFSVLADLVSGLSNVELVDFVPKMSDFYHSCDTFILPSIDDGFGLSLFEAMGQGIPCIATHNCGASELLTSEHDSLLIDAFSVQQIKDSLTRMRESKELRHTIGVNGLETITKLGANQENSLYHQGITQLMDRAFPNT